MFLEFKWTVSRGRDTYGYNICTLYANSEKVARCNGGGYDMTGTCLGNFIAKRYAERLRKLKIPMSQRNGVAVREYYGLTYHDPDFNPAKAVLPSGKTVEQAEKNGDSFGLDRYQQFYKASSNVPSKQHRIPLIDGACGWSSVERIANAIKLTLHYQDSRSKNSKFYRLDDSSQK